jgi:hypothetical protein
MQNKIIWIGLAVVTVLLIMGSWWQRQKRKREIDDLKKRGDQAMETLINNKDAVIETLQNEIKAQQEENKAKNSYPQIIASYPTPKSAVQERDTTAQPVLDDEKTTPQRSEKKPQTKKEPKKATPEEIALYGHLTHELESTDLQGQITLIEAFLANPIARQYKGLMSKKLSSLRKQIELVAVD